MSSISPNSGTRPTAFHRPSLLRLLLRTVLLWREDIDSSRLHRNAFGLCEEHRAACHRYSGHKAKRRALP